MCLSKLGRLPKLRSNWHRSTRHRCDCGKLADAIILAKVPHFTTLQKASRRLLAAHPIRKLCDETVPRIMKRKPRVPLASIDSTGLQCTSASAYSLNRRARVGETWKQVVDHRYPKLGVVCDARNHFILAFQTGRGRRPDVDEFRDTLKSRSATRQAAVYPRRRWLRFRK